MDPKRVLAGAALALAVVASHGTGRAEAPSCGPKITRAVVAACALAASPAVRGERYTMEAVRGREVAAGVILPSNPVVAVTAGWPVAGTGKGTVSWSGSLAQEIEIAGQRGARLDVARAEIDAQGKRAAMTERELAAAALTAYFEALSARDDLALAERLIRISQGLTASVNARAEQGLIAPVDADVAYAASMRVHQARASAERRAAAATATLAAMLGLDSIRATVQVEGELAPLPVLEESVGRLADQAGATRAEIDVARAEVAAGERRAALLRRARVPNVTLSVFVQNDSLNARILGGGVSVPIPLPGPLGRTNAGEIAEATALARHAGTEVERLQRRVRLEVVTAAQVLASRRRELSAFDPKRMARAEEGLASLAQELAAGRLSVRDALLSQQGLIELLQAHLEARRALCIASVELARAAGVALDRGAP